jgi:hypothetical protein
MREANSHWLNGFLVGIGLGFCLMGLLWSVAQPNCPEEDSCTINYYHGEWHIKEVKQP